ncbi:MAG: threonine/serine exporter family protein, partial [Propionibacteriaceae bacterium]|nr:threonine/serine exporter family protein [Propionibacteriaceae bacterium]
IDVNYNVILASYYPGEGLPPITAIRTVSPILPNLSKAYAVNDLVNQIQHGLTIGRATKRLDRIRKDRLPYPRWLAALAAGGISMSVQLFYTTAPVMLILALITGVLINRFVYLLGTRGLPTLFQQIFGGWLIVLIATGFSWLNAHPALDFLGYISPTTIAVGCVFQLVAGARFVAAIQDAIDGFYVTATARILEVVMLTAGLVIGLVTGLDFARRLGLAVYISSDAPVVGWVPAQFFAAGLTALFWAVSRFANRRTIAVTLVVTLVGFATRWLVLQIDVGPVVAAFAGPMVAALVATILVRRFWQIPTFGVINAMGVPFVPGLTLYLGLIQLVGSTLTDPDPSKGSATLGTAAAIALAVSAGASLGIFFGQPVSEKLMLIPRPWQQHKTTAATIRPARGRLRHVGQAAQSEPEVTTTGSGSQHRVSQGPSG